MKAKKSIPETSEQPKAPPAPLKDRLGELLPWQIEIVNLAEAYLSINDEENVVPDLLRRSIGICSIVEEICLRNQESEIENSMALAMQTVQEHLQVAKWITSGRPLCSRWF